MNRETWLQRATELLRPHFTANGLKLPDTVRVSVGFPSKGGTRTKSRIQGQCWMPEATADHAPQVYINPIVADGIKVLAILVHELIHACGLRGHNGPFKAAHSKLGLIESSLDSVPGEALTAQLHELIERDLGDYPHPPLLLNASEDKKQTTRLIKVTCPRESCKDDKGKAFTVRMARSWLERAGYGPPLCPNCEGRMVPELDSTKEETEEEG